MSSLIFLFPNILQKGGGFALAHEAATHNVSDSKMDAAQ